MGAHPHGRGRVCGWHREHTLCYLANFLADLRRRRCNLRHCPDGPSLEGEILLLSVHAVVSRVPAPCVAHSFDVERGAGLASWIYWQRRELDAYEACLAGDKPHQSRVLEEAPSPINIGVFISHGV